MTYSRTLEEQILIGVFCPGMLAWWAYNEHKQDHPDEQ